MVWCSRCGSAGGPGARFCSSCGAALEAPSHAKPSSSYAKPSSSKPSYSKPSYGKPSYSKPSSSTPSYSKPSSGGAAAPKGQVAGYRVQGGERSTFTPTTHTQESHKKTYEQQPAWAYAEQEKNATGQYKHGQWSQTGPKYK